MIKVHDLAPLLQIQSVASDPTVTKFICNPGHVLARLATPCAHAVPQPRCSDVQHRANHDEPRVKHDARADIAARTRGQNSTTFSHDDPIASFAVE